MPETSESYGGSYRLKAGLITADELVLAGDILDMGEDNYLSSGMLGYGYWSMTPGDFPTAHARVWYEVGVLSFDEMDDLNAVRPVINVTTNNGFASGSGTVSDPYVIS